ncbi:TPA: hypothetical protein ACX41Z_004491, partial [Escherichia coli]
RTTGSALDQQTARTRYFRHLKREFEQKSSVTSCLKSAFLCTLKFTPRKRHFRHFSPLRGAAKKH